MESSLLQMFPLIVVVAVVYFWLVRPRINRGKNRNAGGSTSVTGGGILIPGGTMGRAILAVVVLIIVGLLYRFSVEFRLIFPVLVIGGLATGAFWASQWLKAREQTALIKRLRQDHDKFQLSHDFHGVNGETGLMIDAKRFELGLYENGGRNMGAFTHREIIRSEIVEDGGSLTSTNRGSQLAGAVVGGALLGGVGVIVGGLSGKKQSQPNVSKISVDVTVKSVREPLWTITLLDSKKPLLRSSTEVKDALQAAKDIHALLSVFIRKADDEDKASAPVQVPTPVVAHHVNSSLPAMDSEAFSVELTKLAKLKEQGVLDDSEFIEMKQALMDSAKRQLAK